MIYWCIFSPVVKEQIFNNLLSFLLPKRDYRSNWKSSIRFYKHRKKQRFSSPNAYNQEHQPWKSIFNVQCFDDATADSKNCFPVLAPLYWSSSIKSVDTLLKFQRFYAILHYPADLRILGRLTKNALKNGRKHASKLWETNKFFHQSTKKKKNTNYKLSHKSQFKIHRILHTLVWNFFHAKSFWRNSSDFGWMPLCYTETFRGYLINFLEGVPNFCVTCLNDVLLLMCCLSMF